MAGPNGPKVSMYPKHPMLTKGGILRRCAEQKSILERHAATSSGVTEPLLELRRTIESAEVTAATCRSRFDPAWTAAEEARARHALLGATLYLTHAQLFAARLGIEFPPLTAGLLRNVNRFRDAASNHDGSSPDATIELGADELEQANILSKFNELIEWDHLSSSVKANLTRPRAVGFGIARAPHAAWKGDVGIAEMFMLHLPDLAIDATLHAEILMNRRNDLFSLTNRGETSFAFNGVSIAPGKAHRTLIPLLPPHPRLNIGFSEVFFDLGQT